MNAIHSKIALAKKEVILVVRQLTAMPILSAIKDKEAEGVPVFTLLSPDWAATQTGIDLIQWLRQNNITGVYKDTLVSGSYIIIIDERTVIISDLPFSQRVYEPADQASASAAAFGFVTVINDPALAHGMAGILKTRIVEQNKVL